MPEPTPSGSPAAGARVHHLEPIRRRTLYVFAGVFGLLWLALALVPVLLPLLVPRLNRPPVLAALLLGMAAVLGLAVAAILVLAARRVRLVTSPEGIVYYQLGYSIHSTWDNVVRVQLVPVGFLPMEGLVLREPGLRATALVAPQVRWGRQDLVIPLTLFGWWWRDRELGEEIRRYAAHLPREMVA